MVLRQSQMQPAPLLDTLLSWQIRGARSIAPLLPWHSLPAGARRSRPLCIHHAATHRPVSGAHTGEEELKWPGTSAPPSHAAAWLIVPSTDRRHDLNLICRHLHARCGAATQACHLLCSRRRATCSRARWRQYATLASCTLFRTSPSPTSTCPGRSNIQVAHEGDTRPDQARLLPLMTVSGTIAQGACML